MTEPTQADREAAADFADWHEGFKTENEVHQLARALASHAEAARADERRAIVEWLRGPFIQGRHPEDAAFARHIANAIEALDHKDRV